MIDTKYAYRIFIWKSLGNFYLPDAGKIMSIFGRKIMKLGDGPKRFLIEANCGL
jgi:hypothetical protein